MRLSLTKIPSRLLIILAMCVVGCDRGPSSNRVTRQSTSPTIANDARLVAFIGDWAEGGNPSISIVRNADGSATVFHPYGKDSLFDSVVNNVRFDGEKLCYDVYYYYNGEHVFPSGVGDHPFSGKRCQVTLETGKGPDRLGFRFDEIESTLERVRKGD